MKLPPIVSPEEWEAARRGLLVEEKVLTRARDAPAAKRRRMPWMAVEKEYRFFYEPDVTTFPASGGAYPERACAGKVLKARLRATT